MYNKMFKRAISFTLSLIIAISALPLNIAFANIQNHVSDLTLKNVFSANQTGYNINFSWNNPIWSSSADGSYTIKDDPEGFKLQMINATSRETAYTDIENFTSATTTSGNTTQNLTNGSIYEFRVMPYHYHTTADGKKVLANYNNQTRQESVLFMTDLEVEATGKGNTLTVTFDNPQYEGDNIFSGYRIYYQKGGASVSNFNNYADVSIDNVNLVPSVDQNRNGVQRLTYQIIDNAIGQGEVYAVKVEPLYNSDELRNIDKLSYKTILVGNEYKRISFKTKSDKEYRTNNVHVSIPLEVIEDGKDFLKLSWYGIKNTSGKVEKIEIYSGESQDATNVKLGVIYSSDAVYVNKWRINKPAKKTYYKLLVYIEGKDTPIDSIVATYDPVAVNITPNRPNLYLKQTSGTNEVSLDVYWDVFLRYPYTESEKEFIEEDGTYIDTNVNYDIWISDSLENLNNINLPKLLDNVSAINLGKQFIEDTKTPVYSTKVTEYVTKNASGTFVNKKIEKNKTYYVKLVAKKPVQGEVSLSAQESIAQIYIVSDNNISVPQALSKPPLKIQTNEDGNEQITKTEINIEWKTKWFEIYDLKMDKWHTSAAVRNGQLVFENILSTDNLVSFYDKTSVSNLVKAFVDAGLKIEDAEKLTIRYIDLTSSDIKYELRALEFEDIQNQGGYEQYIESILNNTEENANWQEINPAIDGNDAEYKITGLKPNTLYAVLLRPYRIISDNKKEAYPTYITVTTLPNETNIEVTPITPQLTEVSHADTSVTVKWDFQADSVAYELAISEIPLTNPEESNIKITPEEIEKNSTTIKDSNGITYISYKANSLFPNTSYYFWVRAISKIGEQKKSEWSNTLHVVTNALLKPEPPSGLGLASKLNLNVYNSTNNKNYVQADKDYIILEFSRNAEDNLAQENITATSNNSAEMLLGSDSIKTYMVMFKSLQSNKKYYFRAKTKMIVSKSGTGDIQTAYTYIIEASLTDDFKDVLTIEIPQVEISGDKTITMESDWTPIYSYKTKYTSDSDFPEYDANVNDSLYPLPTEDFEITYEAGTKTLVYRLRSNKKDDTGSQDNLVDQRFITRLLSSKAHNYNLDLTSHKGHTIVNRVVEIPYTILTALTERKITLGLTVGGTTFNLNPGFLNTAEVKSLQGLGYSSTVKIAISQHPTTTPILEYGKIYSTTPQKIRIDVSNGSDTKEINYTGSDIDINLKLSNRYLAQDTNIGAFIQTSATSYWQRLNSDYNVNTGSLKIKSKQLGTYTTISTEKPTVTNINNIETLYNINSKINIKDINNIDLTKSISVVQFNNIVSAVLNNKKETNINTSLSTADYNSLKKANLLLEGSVVAREKGISNLVKVYETKTKKPYKNNTNLSTTKYKDIAKANKIYQTNLLKAGELGFFTDTINSRPKDAISLEDVLYIVDIILQDSGI